MKKRLEEKILAEIRRKVIERDLKRQTEQEKNEMREANIEALTELTSLSREEVELIADETKLEFLANQKKRRKKIAWYASAIVIVGFILFLIFKPGPEIKTRIVEDDFSENKFEWVPINSFTNKRYFEEGRYHMETNKDDWCYWDNVQIELPENYDVEVSSQWINGKYGDYGVGLDSTNSDYYAFTLRADGAARYGKVVKKKWVIEDSWKKSMGKAGKNQTNLQKIEVRGKNFNYFVNKNLVQTGTIDFDINNVALRCCDEQAIVFHYLKVINADTKKVVFEDDFTTPNEQWSPENNYFSESVFKNGKYLINGNSESCYFSKSMMLEITDYCEINLSSVWRSGELSSYGLMILNDDKNYYSCELQNDGKARLVESKNDEYVYVQNYVNIGAESDGEKAIEQKIVIQDGQISYFANGQHIKDVPAELAFPAKIALRVCGKQSVAFEKLSIKYFEYE